MRDWIIGQGFIVYVFAGCLAVGVLSAFIANHGYKKLIKESEIMGNTQNRLLKYIKLKFGSYYKLNMRPQDTRALAKHYMYKYKIGFMNVLSWIKLSKLSVGIMGIAAVICLLWMQTRETTAAQMVSMIGCAVIAASVVYIQHRLYDFSEKQSMLEWYLMDYLENFLKNKIESAQGLNIQRPASVAEKNVQLGKKNDHETMGKINEKDFQVSQGQSETFNKDSKEALFWKNAEDKDHEAAAARMRGASVQKRETASSYFSSDEPGSEDEIDAKIVEDILKEFLN